MSSNSSIYPLDPQATKISLFIMTVTSCILIGFINRLRRYFKSIFSPYGDKKIGEYFEPLTIKPLSKKLEIHCLSSGKKPDVFLFLKGLWISIDL